MEVIKGWLAKYYSNAVFLIHAKLAKMNIERDFSKEFHKNNLALTRETRKKFGLYIRRNDCINIRLLNLAVRLSEYSDNLHMFYWENRM